MRNRVWAATAVPIALLVLVLILTLSFAFTGSTALAEDSMTPASEVSFGHVSDIHYFPEEYCSDDVNSDFYHSTTGDTKLVAESGAIGMAHIKEFIENAKVDAAPHYLFATGDLSKNGEHAALIDVANGLRYLQEEVRKEPGYEGFQVFVTQGNHDLYNGSGRLYDQDGNEYVAEVVTSAQFALIFAGLGYPDMTYDELQKIYPADYWSSDETLSLAESTQGYVESKTAEGITISYYDQHLTDFAASKDVADIVGLYGGDNINALSYFADIEGTDFAFFLLDGTDRETTDDVVPVRIGKAEYDLIGDEVKGFYRLENNTYVRIADKDVEAAFAEDGTVYADTGYDHITGGRLKEGLLDWMRRITAEDKDRTYVTAYHFNVLPHFEQEDDILKDFVFYNWEYIAKEFLEMGIRYGFSGHMHSSDIAYYHDAAGRTFYDVETGSFVSYGSPRRYVTIQRYDLGEGKVGEKVTSSLIVLDGFEGMEADDYNSYITERLYGKLVERIVDHFVTMRTIDDLDIPGLLDGLLPDALKNLNIDKLLNNLIETVKYDLYPDGYPGFAENDQPSDIMDYLKRGAAQELIGMKFGAEGAELTLAQIFSFIMMAHAEGLEPTTDEVFGELPPITATASDLIDPNDEGWRARYIHALRDFAEKCDSGQLARDLFGTLLDTLYYDADSILKTLLEYEFDLVDMGLDGGIADMLVKIINQCNFAMVRSLLKIAHIELDENTMTMLEEAFKVGSGASVTVSAERFVLNDALNTLWPVAKALVSSLLGINLTGDTLYASVDGLLDSYLTDSFYVGLSGIAKNIVIAYATDDEPDLTDHDPSKKFVLVPHEGYASEYSEPLSYVSGVYASDEYNKPDYENGRLPSHLTANFLPSEDDGARFAVSFYTAEEIGAQIVLTDAEGNVVDIVTVDEAYLDENGDADHRKVTVTGDSGKVTLIGGTYAQYIPLIDLGLLTISHTQTGVENSDGSITEFLWDERDNAEANSVIYKNRWIAVFEGLTYDATYTYAVRGCYGSKVFDLAAYTGNDPFTFTTVPPSGATDFDFVAIADMQGMIESMYEDSASAIDAIMNGAGGYDFVLNAGDMADNGDNYYQWGWALNENLEFFAGTSTFNAAGNHEDENGILSDFYHYGSMQPSQGGDSGLYYSFDYATAHVIVLNTNDLNDQKGISDAQMEWLKGDLEANRNAKWTFVLMHKSLYSGGSHSFDSDVAAMRKQLVPLFYDYGVDIVFAGHDHTYTVTQCLDGNGDPVDRASNDGAVVTMNSDGKGVMYVTLGTIGTKFYDYVSNPEIEGKFSSELSILATLAEQTFAKVSVRGDTLTFTGYVVNADGTLSAIYNEPEDDLLLVKILVPIAGVILIAGIVVTVVLVRKKKKAAASASAAEGGADFSDDGADASSADDGE